ncbi:hypothetical protein N9N67_11980, partial [Bacteriovoracaceae bacterium]|nr:hypothetical protein [Bacteriovoracaceae bacterium]
FPKKHEFRMTIKNKFGKGNHFQGATIIPNTNSKYFVISGADKKVKKSWLYIGKFETLKKKSKTEAKLLNRIELGFENNEWHVGGLGIYGDVLAIPMESLGQEKNSSTISFYQIRVDSKLDAISLVKLKREISLNGFGAGAVDIISNESSKDSILKMDVAIFTGGKFKFFEKINLMVNDKIVSTTKIFATDAFRGSNVDLVKNCKGQYYLLSLHNDSFLEVFNTRKNSISLYRFDHKTIKEKTAVEKIKTKRIRCRTNCNFRAAAGVILDENKLKLFSVKFYRSRWKQMIKGRFFTD